MFIAHPETYWMTVKALIWLNIIIFLFIYITTPTNLLHYMRWRGKNNNGRRLFDITDKRHLRK